MDMSVLSSLTPEERAALKAALDKAEEPDPMDQMAELFQFHADEIKSLREELANLKALVTDEIVGGIREAYDGRVREERMGEFKGKYGSMLDPLAEPFKKTFGADLHDKAFDYMDSLRSEEGFTDEVGDSKLKEVIAQIKEKLGISDAPVAAVEEVKVEPEAKAEEAEEPEEDAQKAWNEIEAMKKRDEARAAARDKKPLKKGA